MSVRDLTILGSSSQQPTRSRSHGAYLLRWNGEGLLFDPGEGTQRQFIFANVAPTCVTRIFVSHFHGDHCLGLGSMIMRLNLDKITHPIHCYYPASGKKYFDRLRYGTIYHETVEIIEHPVSEEGIVHQDESFQVHATFLNHGVDCIGWRITEPDRVKFSKEKLAHHGIEGPLVRKLQEEGSLCLEGNTTTLEDVSTPIKGDTFAYIADTRSCEAAFRVAKDATMLLCESTYLENHKDLAHKHAHLTAAEAARIAKTSHVQKLILTHFSARYREMEEFKTESRSIFPNTEVAEDLKVFEFPRRQPS